MRICLKRPNVNQYFAYFYKSIIAFSSMIMHTFAYINNYAITFSSQNKSLCSHLLFAIMQTWISETANV